MQKFHPVDDVEQRDLTINYIDIGRVMVCVVYNDEGDMVASGAAQCHPHDKDNPKLGAAIALRRALGEYEATLADIVRNKGRG